MINFKKCFIISLTIVGAMIGVGFSTGRELVTFFAKYGSFCFALVPVAFGSFYLLIYLVMNNNFKAFAYKNCKNRPAKRKNNAKTAKMCEKSVFFDVIVFVCQVAISSTMVAAFGQLFFLSFSAPVRLLCYLGLFVVVYCLLNFATKGVHVLNIVLSLVMMVFISVVFLLSILHGGEGSKLLVPVDIFTFINPVSYAGMNIVIVYPMLKEFALTMKSKKEVLLSALLISLLITLCIMVVISLLLFYGGAYIQNEMPVLSMVKNLSYALGTFYTFVICVSIFTTLISTAYGAAKFLEKKIRFSFALLLVLGASFSVGLFGFGNLIDWLYPIVGFVCFVFLVFLYVKNRKMV